MLGLVGETRAAVLQLGDLGLGIARRGPVGVRQPLAFSLAVEPDQVVRRRRRDAALLGQPLEHLAVALAGVAPHDRAQRRVGLHGRGVDADPVALDQPVLRQPLQHPGEDRLVHLQRQARARPAQPGVVGHRLGRAQAQELAQRQAVGAAPLQAALAVDPFEVADQVHAKVAARRQRRPALPAGIVGRALLLGEAVEPGLDQHRLQAIVEGVPRRARQLRPADHQIRLPLALPPQRHAHPRTVTTTANQPRPTSSTGCSHVRCQVLGRVCMALPFGGRNACVMSRAGGRAGDDG